MVIPDDALAFVLGQNTMALATVGEGSPQIAPLFYMADADLRMYWFSHASSAHSRNLERNPAAAVTVFQQTDQWMEIRGVQMEGSATAVLDKRLRRGLIRSFSLRFGLGPAFRAVLSRSTLYCFEPAWLRWIDNSRGFGFKAETGQAGKPVTH
jgi:uncharacterized protein YhbP (UPF0306 family)